ncbi:MAG: aldo/keto reductase [Nitrospinae bacterium]|nr:aldo/keto reductase [Nitrospinota bacterium]
MTSPFQPKPFGDTGFMASPLGVGASYGVNAAAIEEAFERGVNYFYWAWARRGGMRGGLRALIPRHREKMFIVITSLLPSGPLVRNCVTRALKALGTDYVDGVQFFTFPGRAPFQGWQLDEAFRLRDRGLVRHIGLSGHDRPNLARLAGQPFAKFIHIRYNAIHRGAENDFFPALPPHGTGARPGVVAFTVTSWRQLISADPAKLGGLPVPTAGDCYRFALTHPGVDVCMTGPANGEQMRHALDAAAKGPMALEELEWMRAVGDKLYRKG